MPYLLQQYSSQKLVGPATGTYEHLQTDPRSSGPISPPGWDTLYGGQDQLNVALVGLIAEHWKLPVDHLTALVSGKGYGNMFFGGFPMWSGQQQEDYRNSWKMLTIFLGPNDVLTNLNACSDDWSKRYAIVDSFRWSMWQLFDHLVKDEDGIFKKIYINLMMMFGVTNIGVHNSNTTYCKFLGKNMKVIRDEIPCMYNGGDLHAKGALIDEVIREMNDVLVEIASEFDQKRPDFGVNLVQMMANQQIVHQDLTSVDDCFHPTEKAHRILGTGLWNAMLRPSYPGSLYAQNYTPGCADPSTKLVTFRSADARRNYFSKGAHELLFA